MSVKKDLILACFEEHVRALQALVNSNLERRVTSKDALKKVEGLLDSDGSIIKSDYSGKISKMTREVHRLTDLLQSKNLEFQTKLRLVDEVRRPQEELSKEKGR